MVNMYLVGCLQYNRIVGQRIGQRLTGMGISWCFTYDTSMEEDLGLSKRADVANRFSKLYGAKNVILISLHHNACGNGAVWVKANGWEIYTTKGDTVSDKYADIFVEAAKEVLEPKGIKIRGHKEYNFTVIQKTVCPSVLVEFGFYTDKKEVEWLMSEEGINANVESVIRAIEKNRRVALFATIFSSPCFSYYCTVFQYLLSFYSE